MSDENAQAEALSAESPEPSPDQHAETVKLPMNGIRVIDLGTFLAGPYAASILGEFGAEVLKVEHPVGGDICRRYGTPTARGDTLAWLSEPGQPGIMRRSGPP